MTFCQLCKKTRPIKVKKSKTPLLGGRPQRAIRLQVVTTTTPKKPNSAQRKIVKGCRSKSSKTVIAYVSGEKHKLQPHNVVLIQGVGARDVPGCARRYSVVRGHGDHQGVEGRKNGRSLYGTKKQ